MERYKLIRFSLVFLLICLAKVLTQDAKKLAEIPADTVALEGDTVKLRCSTVKKDYPPSWSHRGAGRQNARDVYLVLPGDGGKIVGRMVEGYHSRFLVVGNEESGDYSLEIRPVHKDDAGTYTCTARGGLGQSASAELIVLESPPECRSNASLALGEKVCDKEPDFVAMSCRFKFHGNTLPSVEWTRTDQPLQVIRTETAPWTDDQGFATFEFVLKADQDGLNGSSFTCSIGKDSRFSCNTPVLQVLKIGNVTESKILPSPEEVHCASLPLVTEKGCRWVRRENDEDTTVAEGRLLNLYRPEMVSGTYVCIIECDILGQHCPVEALTITYQPAERSTFGSTSVSGAVIGAVLATAIGSIIIVLTVFLYKKLRRRPPTRDPGSTQESQNLNPKDEPDAKLGKSGGKAERLRLLEESATLRMRENALKAKVNPPPPLGDNTDVAEGLGPNAETKKEA